MNLSYLLATLLTFAVLTVWVPGNWATSVVQMGALLAAAEVLLADATRRRAASPGAASLAAAAIAVWGVVQVVLGWTAVTSATQHAVLYWLAAAALVFLGRRASTGAKGRQAFLHLLLVIGSAVCLLGIIQLFTSNGLIFWLFPSGYDTRVIGPFVSPNNYAAFAELLIPIALFFGLRRRNYVYLAVGAGLVATVVASASRAGVALALVEVVAVFGLDRFHEDDGRNTRHAATLPIFAALTAIFILVVGWQQIWGRLQGPEQLLGLRRNLLESSVEMLRAQPMHGFGLGTWTFVYPQFATVDPGAVANHAHNEWAQWAAEGGFPALLLMLAVFAVSLRPAAKAYWGIGVIAVFLHSTVDYPFLRFGLAAWIFVLIGALSAFTGERPTAVRSRRKHVEWLALPACATALLLLAGAYAVGRLAWADVLFRRATPESLKQALRLSPGEAEYYFALAAAEPDHARMYLEHAIAANPYFSKARLSLAAEVEGDGDLQRAEDLLLETARRDHLSAPAWALANFYFRQQRPDAFWRWARRAAQMAYGERDPLFTLCFSMDDNAAEVRKRLGGDRATERTLLGWLTAKQRLADAHPIALALARENDAGSLPVVLDYVERSLSAGQTAASAEVWEALEHASGGNRSELAGRGFDWRVSDAGWLSADRDRDDGVTLTLSGRQPEECWLMSRYAVLMAGKPYRLRFEYRTFDLPAETGLSWFVNGVESSRLTAAESWKSAEWDFQALPQADRLALRYVRTPGTIRSEGSIHVRNVRLERKS